MKEARFYGGTRHKGGKSRELVSIDPRAALRLGTGALISAFLVKQHTYRTGNLPKLQFTDVAQQERTVGLATRLSASEVPAPGSSSEEDWGSGGLSRNGYGHLEGAESRVPRSRPTTGDLSAATTLCCSPTGWRSPRHIVPSLPHSLLPKVLPLQKQGPFSGLLLAL